MTEPTFQSAIYEGWVRHRRFHPHAHEFRYRLFMMYLDLDELDRVLAMSPWWSKERFNLARFRRRDYLGPPNLDLRTAVLDHVAQATGTRPTGPVRMLSHLRYYGYCFNPVTFYYVFQGNVLDSIVAEITNTPWGERHRYLLRPRDPGNEKYHDFVFDKAFHVSPFLNMDLGYRWLMGTPGENLLIHMDVSDRADEKQFDATLLGHRRPVNRSSLRRVLVRYPLMTARVMFGIHWQAFRLWLKRNPVYDHPSKQDTSSHVRN